MTLLVLWVLWTATAPWKSSVAHAELDRLGISYTSAAFIDSARAGNLEVVKLFVVAGMDLDATDGDSWTALHRAAFGGHLSVIKFLVGRGASVTATTDDGHTALHFAAAIGRLAVVEYLLGQGADLDAKGTFGWTALHWAAWGGQLEVVRYLVGHGVSLTARDDNSGYTAKDLARRKGHAAVANYLASVGG